MRLLGIAIRAAKRAPTQELGLVEVTEEGGLTGDFRGKRGKTGRRQVTVLSRDQWQDACRELVADLAWHTRRANLYVSDVRFGPEHVGKEIYFYQGGVILEITGETSPCERMDEARSGLRGALSPPWRGGVTCRVVQGGLIQVGDELSVT